MKKSVIITGIRGLPASHGGFETFAEQFATFLVNKDWNVSVFCQEVGSFKLEKKLWKGINLLKISLPFDGALATIVFDFISILWSLFLRGTILTLGYNTAIFNVMLRIFLRKNVINMDGIEWKRDKWGVCAKLWFWFNEKLGCLFGNILIADHPEIKKHLERNIGGNKAIVIPYGSERIVGISAEVLSDYSLEPGNYSLIIARPEPENSIYEIVSAFSVQQRNHKLVVLGKYSKDSNDYHAKVLEAASDEVIFLGAIYDKFIVNSLRYHAAIYFHGHTVGGTNPSLVEALGATSAVIAHDNKFNRWVAGDSALYFSSIEQCAEEISSLLSNMSDLNVLRDAAKKRHSDEFELNSILSSYEKVISSI